MKGGFAALALAGTVYCVPGQAGQYRVVSFDMDGSSYAAGINTAGQVVGNRGAANAPFLWQAGTFSTLPAGVDGRNPYLNAISDDGIVVGVTLAGYNGPDPIGYFYRYAPRTRHVVNVAAPMLGPSLPTLTGVDRAGIAVGYAPVMSGPIQPVTFSGRQQQLAGGCTGSWYLNVITGINASGSSTGWCAGGANQSWAAFFNKGGAQTLILSSLAYPEPFFIDNAGRVGGSTQSMQGTNTGFLFDTKTGATLLRQPPDYTDGMVVGTGRGDTVIGQSSGLKDGFWVYSHGDYYAVHVPSPAPGEVFSVMRVNASGSVVGNWYDGVTTHGVAAICDADQVPCTQ